MPQLHIHRVRYGTSVETMATTIQQFTGMGLLDARRVAEQAVAGQEVTLQIDDFGEVFELADMLLSMGVDAEPDENDI
jgi:hypothetical protein